MSENGLISTLARFDDKPVSVEPIFWSSIVTIHTEIKGRITNWQELSSRMATRPSSCVTCVESKFWRRKLMRIRDHEKMTIVNTATSGQARNLETIPNVIDISK